APRLCAAGGGSGMTPMRATLATILAVAVLATPLGDGARSEAMRRIGFLAAGSEATTNDRIVAFGRRLHELGWIEGRNIAIDYRYADGRGERFKEIAAEFVTAKVDVIVTWGTTAVRRDPPSPSRLNRKLPSVAPWLHRTGSERSLRSEVCGKEE